MNYLVTPHGTILFLTASLSLMVGMIAWQRKSLLAGRLLTLFMLSICIWALFSGVEAGSFGLSNKVFWSKMEYFGFVWASPLCFLFIMAYSNHWKWIKPYSIAIIVAISVITLVLAWTNESHGLIWSAFHPGNTRLNLLIYEHGTWFFIYTAFQFALFCTSLIILIRDLKYQKSPYRQQTLTILAAIILPAIMGILYSFRISPIPGLDWMPICTFVTGLLFTWSIYHYRLLDLVPIAREVLVEQMLDGMIVLDDQQRIIDINPSARRMIKNGSSVSIGDSLSTVLPELYATLTGSKSRSTTQVLAFQETSADQRFVDVRFSIIQRSRTNTNCSLLILRDITRRKTIEDSLNKANQELEKRLEEIQKLQNQLREESIRDPLTNLYNRRYLEDSLQREFAHAARDHYPVSIIMADIDHFKKVNDTYGHTVGDIVLQKLSGLLMSSFRVEDIVCRYGGEEFIVVMPGTAAETAFLRTENFRQTVEQTNMEIAEKNISITISAGAAVFPENGETVNSVIKQADQALYQAKSAGRNRVVAS